MYTTMQITIHSTVTDFLKANPTENVEINEDVQALCSEAILFEQG